jgi:arylsulfatase A-like enzyme
MPGSTDRPFASAAFQGRSANGPYGDAVEELDWSCGQILKALADWGLSERTLVIWTSDNGAVGWDPPQGSNAPLRGWGYNTSEGAQRVPCLARWPGRIPDGVVSRALTTMMDITPTVSALAGVDLPSGRTIDGHDIRSILFDRQDVASPYDAHGFFYYHMHQLQAVRSGRWKLYLPLANKITNLSGDYAKGTQTAAELYDVRHDLSESHDVAAANPGIVEHLTALATHARRHFGDWDREGGDQRPAGWVDHPTARRREHPSSP